MAYAARPADFQRHLSASHAPPARPEPRKPRLLIRLFDAIFVSRQREAQRAVEDYMARAGHRLTDSIEREIGERLLNGGWNARR